MKKYLCKLCKATFEVADGEVAVCPVCGATGDKLEVIDIPTGYTHNIENTGTETAAVVSAALAMQLWGDV